MAEKSGLKAVGKTREANSFFHFRNDIICV
jgi:hypothetical protein